MKDVVTLEIDAPRERVAALFADPEQNAKWMDDIVYRPLTGKPGMPGSTYRLESKTGGLSFTATVVSRNLPDDVRLILDEPTVTVAIHGTFKSLGPETTRLTSEENFRFKGVFRRLLSVFAHRAIHRVHRGNMEKLKRFAEGVG